MHVGPAEYGIGQRMHRYDRHDNPPPRRWGVRGLCLALMAVAVGCAPPSIQSPTSQSIETWTVGRVFDHVLIIVLENQDFEPVWQHPYMHTLATRGSLLAQFHGVRHPSYPNYLAMVGGQTFDIADDVQQEINARTIADLLEEKQLTWTQYAEGFPGQCFLGSRHARYARKHVPFMSFTSIHNAPARCAHIVDEHAFDPHHLPHYAFFSPDMDHDGHDTSLDTAVAWLQGFLDPLLDDPSVMNHTLIVVTFDESASPNANHIYTVFLGPMVKQGYVEQRPYNHYNILRTIEENFGLGTLGAHDTASSPITRVWSK